MIDAVLKKIFGTKHERDVKRLDMSRETYLEGPAGSLTIHNCPFTLLHPHRHPGGWNPDPYLQAADNRLEQEYLQKECSARPRSGRDMPEAA